MAVLRRVLLATWLFVALRGASAQEGLDTPEGILKEMDKDGDGFLTEEEVHVGVEAKFDTEGEKSEFDTHFAPALKKVFPKADADGDGKLDVKEVEILMKL